MPRLKETHCNNERSSSKRAKAAYYMRLCGVSPETIDRVMMEISNTKAHDSKKGGGVDE